MTWIAYVPTTWASGTSITTTLLAHMETQYTNIIAYLAQHNHDARYYIEGTMDTYFWNIDNDGPGSGLNADTLQGQHASSMSAGVTPGICGFWLGSLGDFSGKLLGGYPNWHIADGTDGSIKLTDLYPIGGAKVGDLVGYQVGATPGNYFVTASATVIISGHTLSIAEAVHTHNLTDWGPIQPVNTYNAGGTTAQHPSLISGQSITTSLGSVNTHNHGATYSGSVIYMDPLYIALIPIQYGNYNGTWSP